MIYNLLGALFLVWGDVCKEVLGFPEPYDCLQRFALANMLYITVGDIRYFNRISMLDTY